MATLRIRTVKNGWYVADEAGLGYTPNEYVFNDATKLGEFIKDYFSNDLKETENEYRKSE